MENPLIMKEYIWIIILKFCFIDYWKPNDLTLEPSQTRKFVVGKIYLPLTTEWLKIKQCARCIAKKLQK